MLTHVPMKERISNVLDDKTLTPNERIEELLRMRDDARDQQRAATEGGMISEDGSTNDLREIDLALQFLGYDPLAAVEEESAATL
ncbi:MAG: hypothetical protein C0606_06010 [Hyphomicrobiales bacterium]|nr:MAG: hypothetical protein C0606_06010 [Hyphomicrobiales bacterium]